MIDRAWTCDGANGRVASYFNDSPHAGTPDDIPVMVRSEPQVNLDWGNMWSDVPENFPWREGPMPPALNEDWFVIRWEGHFRAPATGDSRFAGAHVDGAKMWVGDKLVYDNPNSATVGNDFLRPGPKQDREVSLTAGQRVPIRIELYHHSTARLRMVLWAKSTTGPHNQRTHNLPPKIVPTEWLFSADPPQLPGGWTLGVAGSEYSKAEMLDGSVVLTNSSGGKHTWGKASTGGYRPPVGEYGVLAFDAGGRISVTQADTVSVFNVDGHACHGGGGARQQETSRTAIPLPRFDTATDSDPGFGIGSGARAVLQHRQQWPVLRRDVSPEGRRSGASAAVVSDPVLGRHRNPTVVRAGHPRPDREPRRGHPGHELRG